MDQLADGIEDAGVMFTVAEIEAEGEAAGRAVCGDRGDQRRGLVWFS